MEASLLCSILLIQECQVSLELLFGLRGSGDEAEAIPELSNGLL